ncbi:MAG TPA: hypothetical protein VLL27_09705 [Solirubrobacterales bacterium]|nr:hypothetical protein [Solirubrobacterales bacterium]
MGLADLYRSEVKSAQSKVKGVRSARDRKRAPVVNAQKQLAQLEQRARQARSDSQRQSYERQVDTKGRELQRTRDALDRAEADLSTAESKLSDSEQKLRRQEEADAKAAERKQQQDDQRRNQKERFDGQKRDRESRRAESERAAREASQDQKIQLLEDQASGLELRLLEAEQKAAPPEVTVLFLAASPIDEEPLRLDKETREIQKRMRASDFRDSIFIEWRLARQLTDLVQDLNEVRPNVLHFSGHGNTLALAFEDDNGNSVPLDNNQVGRLLSVAPDPIRLVLFNSCNSASQAELATQQVELAIGMDATVGDDAAQTFAGQFYNSIGFGNSVGMAFDQAVFQVELEHGEGHEVPRLFHASGVDPGTVALVRPES